MSRNDVVPFIIALLFFIGVNAGSCARGYTYGYEAHRREVCERAGGTYMEHVTNRNRRACIGGEP